LERQIEEKDSEVLVLGEALAFAKEKNDMRTACGSPLRARKIFRLRRHMKPSRDSFADM